MAIVPQKTKATTALKKPHVWLSAFVSNIHQRWRQTGYVQSKQIGDYRRPCWNPMKPP